MTDKPRTMPATPAAGQSDDEGPIANPRAQFLRGFVRGIDTDDVRENDRNLRA